MDASKLRIHIKRRRWYPAHSGGGTLRFAQLSKRSWNANPCRSKGRMGWVENEIDAKQESARRAQQRPISNVLAPRARCIVGNKREGSGTQQIGSRDPCNLIVWNGDFAVNAFWKNLWGRLNVNRRVQARQGKEI